jgi:hypothetical protein
MAVNCSPLLVFWLAVPMLIREGQGGRMTLCSSLFQDCLATASMIDTMLDAGHRNYDGDYKG